MKMKLLEQISQSGNTQSMGMLDLLNRSSEVEVDNLQPAIHITG